VSTDAIAAISDLLARYCVLLDREDVDAVAELFVDDAQFHVFGHTYEGPEGVRRVLAGSPRGLHLAGPPVIDFADGRASVLQNLIYADATTHALRLVMYDDLLVETVGGWRFQERRIRFLGPDGLVDKPPVI
jgi:hypothetical protein